MTSTLRQKRALVLGLVVLAALPLAAAHAGQSRAADRLRPDQPQAIGAAGDLNGTTAWSHAGKAGKSGRHGGSRGGRPAR